LFVGSIVAVDFFVGDIVAADLFFAASFIVVVGLLIGVTVGVG
jgi:hypothetical protein